MCSLCGNTGAENFLVAIGPTLLAVSLEKVKNSIKKLKNRILKKE
jgi:hypothetical protein